MLHLFSNSADTVIANDIDDAIKVWVEHTGEKWEDYSDNDTFNIISDEQEVRIRFEDGEEPSGIGEKTYNEEDAYYGVRVSATAREWANGMGRCFLCSTEW